MKKIEEMIAVMTAFKEGKKIQSRFDESPWGEVILPCWNWSDYDYRIKPEPKYETNYIKPYYNDNGEFLGVRVMIVDEDFVIAARDYNNGRVYDWDELMEEINAGRVDTFTQKQIAFTFAFIKDVKRVMQENGGETIKRWHWTKSELGNAAWSYSDNGIMNFGLKEHDFPCRPIINLKKDSYE